MSCGVKTRKCSRAATHDVIVDIAKRSGGIFRDIRKPIERPLRSEVGIAEYAWLGRLALVVANGESDGRTDGRGIADGLVADVQADGQEVHSWDSHSLLAGIILTTRFASLCLRVARAGGWLRTGTHVALAPYRPTFLRTYASPAVWQLSMRYKEIAASFSFESLSGDPHIVPKCRILEQVEFTLLPDNGGKMIYL